MENYTFLESEVYLSGFLAAGLSLLARYAYHGPTPLFLVDANVRSAGKGMLLNSLGRIIFGRDMAVTPCPKDQDSLEKLITSMVMGGFQYVLLDNLSGKFGNPVLDMALTATEWQTRILGVSEIHNAPLKIVWFATGNNVQLGGDMSRRVQHIRLYSPLEHPENRDDFVHPDILAYCTEHRAKLLSDFLTVLVAYHRAGRPKQELIPWGSYEGWSGLVRAALVWAEMPDPALALRPLQEKADEEAEFMAALAGIWERFDPQHEGETTKEFIRNVSDPTDRMSPEDREAARHILEELMKEPDARKLGALLKKHQGRNFGGRMFVNSDKDCKGYVKWSSVPAEAFRQRAEQTRQTRLTRQDGFSAAESAESAEPVSPSAKCREPGEDG